MNEFTFEETNLLCIYNGSGGGTREGLCYLSRFPVYPYPKPNTYQYLLCTNTFLFILQSLNLK